MSAQFPISSPNASDNKNEKTDNKSDEKLAPKKNFRDRRPATVGSKAAVAFNDLPEASLLKTALTDLGKAMGNAAWAFTGSYALSLWAAKAGVKFRVPKDIDIVVGTNSGFQTLAAFNDGKTFQIENEGNEWEGTKMRVQPYGFRLDVLVDGTNIGTLKEVDATSFSGYPVIGLKTLIEMLAKRKDKDDDVKAAKEILSKLK